MDLWRGVRLRPCAVLVRAFTARATATRQVYAASWFVFVVALPVLVATLVLGGAPAFGSAPNWLAQVAASSPLAWMCARLQLEAAAPSWPWLPLLCSIGLLVIGFSARRAPASEVEA